MKKIIVSLILLSSFVFSVFADNAILYGANRDNAYTITQANGVVTETVIANDGTRFDVTAVLNGSKVDFNVRASNGYNYSFVENRDYITAYTGNYDRDSWSPVSIRIDSKPGTSSSPVASNNDDCDGTSIAEACIVAGTVLLCSIALYDICDNLEDAPSTTHHHHRHSRGPDIVVAPDISVGSGSSSSTYQSNNNILYNSYGNIDPIVAFHVPAGNNPDYRIQLNTGTQLLNFYFLRSDRLYKTDKTYRNSSSARTPNPYTTGRETYSSFVFSANCPEFDRFGLYYIYSGSPVGLYLGAAISDETYDQEIVGTINNHDYTDVTRYSSYSGTGPYRFEHDPYTDVLNNIFDFNVGLTFQLTPNLWLMGGCCIDFASYYLYGQIYDATDNLVSEGWVSDNSLNFIPQVGLNLVIGHLDLGTMVNYSVETGFRFDIMAGFAF